MTTTSIDNRTSLVILIISIVNGGNISSYRVVVGALVVVDVVGVDIVVVAREERKT